MSVASQRAVSERSCARAHRALSLVLDEEASAFETEALARHLGRCGSCRSYAAQVSAFTHELRSAAHTHDRTREENGHG